jgi:RNA-directed DNA polymerase
VVDRGVFARTREGTPQGGVISPVLMNVALHGLEQAAGVRYRLTGAHAGQTRLDSPVAVRYADDMVVLCHSREQAIRVKAELADWLAPRGLVFNEDKTRIVHLNEGFDFLGFNVRRYRGTLLTKPSAAAVRRIRERLSAEVRALVGSDALVVIATLNPIIRGWAAYYRIGVSSAVFSGLDRHVWTLAYKWAKRSHPNKSKHWVVDRHFGRFNKSRADRWVFGDRESGAYLHKFAWTKIVRHQMVPGGASPDDPALTDYWATRRRRTTPPLDKTGLRLLQAQHGRCPLCGNLLLHADREPQSPREWEQWITATRQAVRKHALTAAPGTGTSNEPAALRLVHAHCHRRHAAGGEHPAPAPVREPVGLA